MEQLIGKGEKFRAQVDQRYGFWARGELRGQDTWNAGGAFKSRHLSYGDGYRVLRAIALFPRLSSENHSCFDILSRSGWPLQENQTGWGANENQPRVGKRAA